MQNDEVVAAGEQLDVLDEALGRAGRSKVPQAVTVVGVRGAGKSRLIDEWIASHEVHAIRFQRASAAAPSPDRAPSPPAAVIARLLQSRFGLGELPADEALVKLRAGLQEIFGDRRISEVAALLGRYLGVDSAESPLGTVLSGRPEQGAGLAHAVLARVLELDAARGTLAIVIEDLQHADDESLDELDRLSAELADAPLLLVATARPELLVRRPGWGQGRAGHVRLDLPAPPTDQERTRDEAAHARMTALSAAERDVLARASVFGAEFWTGGVVALGRLDAAPPDEAAVFAPDPTIVEVHRILEGLRERGFVDRLQKSSIPEETAWSFCRPVERQLLNGDAPAGEARRRRAFAAQWLESRGGPAREQRLEALARLYEDPGDRRRAAYCLVTAGGVARDRLLLDRAHALYLAGVGLLELDDAVTKMDALYAAADVAARLGRTREAVGLFQEMLLLAWRLDLPAKGGAAHGRIGRLLSTLGDNGGALAHLELAQTLFEVAGDGPGIAAALDDSGRILFLMGEPERSLERHRAAVALREQLGDDRGRALTLSRLGQVLRQTGSLAAAGEHFRAALELRRRVGDRAGVVASLLDLGALERDLGRGPEALRLLSEGRELARAAGERLQECSLSIEMGDCHLAVGEPRAALAEHQAAREIARHFGARALLSEATRGIAEAELALGEGERARATARTALDIAERTGAPPLAGAALRVAAAAAGSASSDAEQGGARQMFDRAVQILTSSGAELELARTLDAYATFEQHSGRADTATELRHQAHLIRRRTTPAPSPATL
ncbi:MAG TPA: tetratricopeptide repeat protein [Polyangia bacterium]|nr:tetratricopeptide repeat protein [Polyangia bacterium]